MSCSTHLGEHSFDLEARFILDAEGNPFCFGINVQEVDSQKTAAKMSCPMPDQEWKGRLPEKKEAENEG